MTTAFTIAFSALGICLAIAGGILVVMALAHPAVEFGDWLTDKVRDWSR